MGAAALAGAAVLTFLAFRRLQHDDAYITFQYARNIASGAGFVFNAGERVLGTTSPLSALLLALVHAVFGDVIPQVAVLLGSLALVAQAALLYVLLRDARPGFAITAALLAWLGWAGAHAWLTLETNLAVAFVLATLAALQHQRAALAGLFLGLAFLTRYDAALLIPVVVAGEWIRTRGFAVKTLAVSAVVVLPWIAWSTWYFGSFLPNTFFAKQQLAAPVEYVRHYVEHFAEQPWDGLGLPLVLGAVSSALWVFGLVYAWRLRSSRILEFLAFGLLVFGAYVRIGPPAGHHWHQYPAALALNVLLLAGLAWIVDAGPDASARRRKLSLGLAAALVGLATVDAARFARAVPDDIRFGWRHRTYAEIASWVREHVKPDQSFLAVEIGTLGYLTRLRMIDASGLINPTNEFPKTQSLDAYIALVEQHRPDLVLAHTIDEAQSIERATGYSVVHRFEWGEPWSVLLVRAPEVLSDR